MWIESKLLDMRNMVTLLTNVFKTLKPATITALFWLNWSQLVDIWNRWWGFTCRHNFVFRGHKTKRVETKLFWAIIKYISEKNHQVSAHLDVYLLTVGVGEVCWITTTNSSNTEGLELTCTEEVNVNKQNMHVQDLYCNVQVFHGKYKVCQRC